MYLDMSEAFGGKGMEPGDAGCIVIVEYEEKMLVLHTRVTVTDTCTPHGSTVHREYHNKNINGLLFF